MHKTTMVVNDRKLARARKLLGTKGIRETYEAALDHHAARDRADMAERQREMAEIFTHIEMAEADFAHARELMDELASRGQHRAAGAADLLIAACARRAGLTLLHYDSDFDTIAGITGQPVEWVVPRGSVP